MAGPAARALADPALRDDLDGLFQLPLSGFTSAKNQLAAKHRSSDRERAAAIKAVPKPSLSAWAVNQAYWNAGGAFAALLDAGEALRQAQRAAMNGAPAEPLGAASERVRTALAPVIEAAQQALQRGGHAQGAATLRRISTTVEALAAYGRAATAPPAGRLFADVSAPGFDAVAALAPAQPTAPARAREPEQVPPAPDPTPTADAAQAQTQAPQAPAPAADAAPVQAQTPPSLAANAAQEQAPPAAPDVVDPGERVADAIKRLADAEYAELSAQRQLADAESAVTAARATLATARTAQEQRAQQLAQAKAAAGRARRELRAAKLALESR